MNSVRLNFNYGLLILFLCGLAAVSSQRAISAPGSSAPQRNVQSKSALDMKALAPIESGPGIVICEPVMAAGVTEDTKAFGAGCSRWLQFVVGGQGQFGKTPLWSALNRARKEIGHSNLGLKPDEMSRLATMIGVTHAVTGTISGNDSQCALTFQLWRISGKMPVGSAITLTGSQMQVLKQLPSLASTLSKLLGAASPHIRTSVGATPEEITELGRFALLPRNILIATKRQRLTDMAKRIPLAGMFYLDLVVPVIRLRTEAETRFDTDVCESLLTSAPDNVLVFGMLAWNAMPFLVLHPSVLQEALQKFPKNFNLVAANSLRLKSGHDDAEAVKAAEQGARIAPSLPEAWSILGDAYSTSADRIRRARTMDKISEKEQTVMFAFYPKWLQAYQIAVRLDPLDGVCWREAAAAATFAGDVEFAETAIWKAVQVDHGDPKVYSWGLEMYHPKWFGDETKRQKIAKSAASDTYLLPYTNYYVAEMLTNAGYPTEARALYERVVPLFKEQIAKNETESDTLHNLGGTLVRLNRLPEATEVLQDIVRKDPKIWQSHFNVGYVFSTRNMPDESTREFEEVLRLNPDVQGAHTSIGFNYKSKNEFDKAETEFKKAISMNPNEPMAQIGMGDVYYSRKQYDEAISKYELANHLNNKLLLPFKRLSTAYCEQRKFDSALQASQFAVQLDPKGDESHAQLGYVYSELKDWEHAVAECRIAIRLNPKNAMAHENLGDVLIEQGHKEEAQAEWKLVLTLDQGRFAEEARKMLTKYP